MFSHENFGPQGMPSGQLASCPFMGIRIVQLVTNIGHQRLDYFYATAMEMDRTVPLEWTRSIWTVDRVMSELCIPLAKYPTA